MVFHPHQTTHPHKGTMQRDQLPVPALVSQAAAPLVTLSRSVAGRGYARSLAAGVRRTYALLGLSGATTLSVGVILAMSCTAWALQLEVPRQVAFLAGYITLAATACVCAALVAVRHSTPKPAARRPISPSVVRPAPEPAAASVPKSAVAAVSSSAANAAAKPVAKPANAVAKPEATAKPSGPNYAVWRRVDRLRVADASRLWCGIEPGHHPTPDVMTWARAILDALEGGELPKSETAGVLAQYKVGWHTEVDRDALKAWAQSKGHAPQFLCD